MERALDQTRDMQGQKTEDNGSVFDRLERYVRWQIETGQVKPGDRLPRTGELASILHAHPITVHKALKRLKDAGLVDRRPRLGTFIRQGRRGFRVAVLMGPSLGDENSYFYRGVLNAIRRDRTVPNVRIVAYDGFSEVGSSDQLYEHSEFQRFRNDCAHHPFAGLIGIGVADSLWEVFRELVPHAAVARMGLGQEVHLDLRHFAQRGFCYLASKGVQRLVYLRTLPDFFTDDLDGLEEERLQWPNISCTIEPLAKRGPHYDESRDTARCVSLMERWTREKQWPDALLVSDDVTMRGIAHALLACGEEKVRTVRVLTWSNQGIRLHYGFPVVRYEVPLNLIASTLIGLIWSRAEGFPVPSSVFPIRGTIQEDEDLSFSVIGSLQADRVFTT